MRMVSLVVIAVGIIIIAIAITNNVEAVRDEIKAIGKGVDIFNPLTPNIPGSSGKSPNQNSLNQVKQNMVQL